MTSDTLPLPDSPEDRLAQARERGREKGELYRQYMVTSVAGLEVGVAIAVGPLFGMWLERKYGFAPWGMLVGLAAGCTHAGRTLYRVYKRSVLADEAEEAAAKSGAGEDPPA